MPDLRQTEEWVFDFITASDERHADAVAAEIRPSARLTAPERIGVYRDQYRLCMQNGLAGEFPNLLRFLGGRAFNHLADAYVHAQPSTFFNITRLRDAFPAFVQQYHAIEHPGFAADLARLEQAMGVVRDAPERAPVGLDSLQDAPPDLVLVPIPARVLLTLRHPVHLFILDVNAPFDPAWLQPQEQWLAVYRYRWETWRIPLEFRGYYLLRLLCTGQPVARSLDLVCGARVDRYEGMTAWLRKWVQAGLFCEVRRGMPAEPSP